MKIQKGVHKITNQFTYVMQVKWLYSNPFSVQKLTLVQKAIRDCISQFKILLKLQVLLPLKALLTATAALKTCICMYLFLARRSA